MTDIETTIAVKNMARKTVRQMTALAKNAKNITAYRQGSNYVVSYTAPDGNNREINAPYWVKTKKDVKEWILSQISGAAESDIKSIEQ